MKRLTITAVILLIVLYSTALFANQFIIPSDLNPYCVPTFECLGVYYTVDSESPGDCIVHYRMAGSAEWKEAFPLWFDKRDKQFRGSIVGLTPDTGYDIRLKCGGIETVMKARTKSDVFPVGKITRLDDGVTDRELHITESGTPEAWHLITPKEGAHSVVDPENFKDNNIVIEASFVIVRGLELKNAARHGILIKEGIHDVVVEDCRFTFWGRGGGPRSFGNTGGSDSAIYAERGASGLVVQHNLIENPRGASNDWDTGHFPQYRSPAGRRVHRVQRPSLYEQYNLQQHLRLSRPPDRNP